MEGRLPDTIFAANDTCSLLFTATLWCKLSCHRWVLHKVPMEQTQAEKALDCGGMLSFGSHVTVPARVFIPRE